MSWDEATSIATRLINAGHRTVFAGGCVRDRLLERPGADIDIATAAHPDDVMQLFERTVAVGAAFGVVLVVGDDDTYDVATFRRDVGIGDGRHPAAIEPSTLEHDVVRRDFTVNGLVMNPQSGEVIDLVGGLDDLASRTLRAIGDAALRFREDGLRLLRAVRFAARLDFTIEASTAAAMREGAARLEKVSGERIGDEVFKMLADPGRARAYALLAEHGQLERALPGVPSPSEAPEAQRVLAALPADASALLALAVLIAAAEGATDAVTLAKRLKRSRDELRHLAALVQDIEGFENLPREDIAPWRRLLATEHSDDLITWSEARARATGTTSQAVSIVAELRARFGAEVATVPAPLLDGGALIAAGVAPGPAVGKAVAALVDAQLVGDVNDEASAREWLTHWLR